MAKRFNDFMSLLDNKDWSPFYEQIGKNFDSMDPERAKIKTLIETFTVVLREYHDWLHS